MNRSTTASWVKLMAGTAALTLALAACGDDGDGEDTDVKDSPSASESSPSTPESSEPPAFTNDECDANQTSADSFKVGGILPLTGNLAFLGPPEIAGVGLAVSEINAAGGVNGAQACQQIEDSGETADLSVSTASAKKLIQGKPSVVIGAASSSVSLNVVDTFANNKIVEVSPANTAVDLSGYSPYYFRTAPPDTVQGSVLGPLIAQDGYNNLGFLVFNDTYGTGLRDSTQKNFEAAGGKCVYGCTGDGDEFPVGQTTFSTEVQAVTAKKPDAIAIIAFDETKSVVPELASTGFDMSKVYFVDGNTSDYSADFDEGTLTNAQGTSPGADPDQTFKDNLSGWYEAANGEPLKDFLYGAESYDATILAALAAAKGGANDSDSVKENYAAVSGATDGEECSTYADCLALIDGGSEIHYTGPSGIGPLDKDNEPESAFIGIYKFDDKNKPSVQTTVEGTKPQ